MHPYEFQSPRRRYLERIRKWVALSAIAITGMIFWGAVAAGIVRYALGFTAENALIFCGVPTSAMAFLYFYVNRHKLSRAAGFD